MRFAVSFSPRPGIFGRTVHERLAAAAGIDYRYLPMRAQSADDLREQLHAAVRIGACGASIATPYKSAAVALCSSLTDMARRTGAVSAIGIEGGARRGDNSDARALAAALGARGLVPRTAIVVGSGATARTSIAVLTERQPGVRIASRGRDGSLLGMDDIDRSRPIDVLVNATPAGREVLEGLDRWGVSGVKLIVDWVRSSEPTTIEVEAERGGVPCISGRELAVYGAAYQLALYTGHAAPYEVVQALVEEARS